MWEYFWISAGATLNCHCHIGEWLNVGTSIIFLPHSSQHLTRSKLILTHALPRSGPFDTWDSMPSFCVATFLPFRTFTSWLFITINKVAMLRVLSLSLSFIVSIPNFSSVVHSHNWQYLVQIHLHSTSKSGIVVRKRTAFETEHPWAVNEIYMDPSSEGR